LVVTGFGSFVAGFGLSVAVVVAVMIGLRAWAVVTVTGFEVWTAVVMVGVEPGC